MSSVRPIVSESDRLEIASDWLLRMEAEALTEGELAEWLQWYDADPANRVAFEKLQATFEGLRGQSAQHKADMAMKLGPLSIAAAAAPAATIRARLSRHRAWFAAAATAAAFAVGIGFWQLQEPGPVQTASFTTERGKHRQLDLPDGSRVQLGARSQLFTNFTPQARYLVLEGGEALFSVAKDPDRPFLVQAASVTIRAVGTEFNVRRAADQTVIAVAEGVVEISFDKVDGSPSMRVKANEQVAVSGQGRRPTTKVVAPAGVAAWQEGRLEFVDEPLRRVVATINRYSAREVVITDQGVGDLRFTGTVTDRRIDQWLEALPDVLPVRVRSGGNQTILISQAQTQ